VEEDLPWDFSVELQSLASEMQREQDEKNGEQPIVKVAAAAKPKSERARKPQSAEPIS